mgnify:FL=1
MPARLSFALWSSSIVVAALAAPAAAVAQTTQPYEGFLCCSLLSNGSWISDLAYDDGSQKIVPAGTPVKFTSFGRWRMYLEIDGKQVGLGNDYSRTMTLDEFAKLYVPTQDPKVRMQAWPAKVREAVLNRKVMRGMTREQVSMSLGHPSTSYNPDLTKPLWQYRYRAGDFQVFWTDDGKVDLVFGPPEVRKRVFVE